MPIGKNAIKRVSNNGYSNVATSSPDMENSTVLAEEKKPTVKTETKKKSATSSTAPKKAASKSAEVKKDAVPTVKKSAEGKKTAPKSEALKASLHSITL